MTRLGYCYLICVVVVAVVAIIVHPLPFPPPALVLPREMTNDALEANSTRIHFEFVNSVTQIATPFPSPPPPFPRKSVWEFLANVQAGLNRNHAAAVAAVASAVD